jgi:hypothetical protein
LERKFGCSSHLTRTRDETRQCSTERGSWKREELPRSYLPSAKGTTLSPIHFRSLSSRPIASAGQGKARGGNIRPRRVREIGARRGRTGLPRTCDRLRVGRGGCRGRGVSTHVNHCGCRAGAGGTFLLRLPRCTVVINHHPVHLTVFLSHNKPANSAFSTINQRNEQAAHLLG